jgi:hypothetical protein
VYVGSFEDHINAQYAYLQSVCEDGHWPSNMRLLPPIPELVELHELLSIIRESPLTQPRLTLNLSHCCRWDWPKVDHRNLCLDVLHAIAATSCPIHTLHTCKRGLLNMTNVFDEHSDSDVPAVVHSVRRAYLGLDTASLLDDEAWGSKRRDILHKLLASLTKLRRLELNMTPLSRSQQLTQGIVPVSVLCTDLVRANPLENMVKLSFLHFVLPEEALLDVIKHSNATLEKVQIEWTLLVSQAKDPWVSVFRALHALPRLRKLELRYLGTSGSGKVVSMMASATDSDTAGRGREDDRKRNELVVEGRLAVKRRLAGILEGGIFYQQG